MKQLFTLFVILSSCLKLSASVYDRGPGNLHQSVNNPDTVKLYAMVTHSDSLQIPSLTNNHTYSLRLLTSANHSISLKIPGLENTHVFGVKVIATANHTDSVMQPVAKKSLPNLYVYDVTVHSDSVQPPLASDHNFSIGLPKLSNNSASLTLPESANDHTYGVKLSAENYAAIETAPVVADIRPNVPLYPVVNHSESIHAPTLNAGYIYSAVSPGSSNHSDGLKIPGFENNHSFSITFIEPAIITNVDSLKVLALITQIKSLTSVAAAKRTDSLRKIQIVQVDSIKRQFKFMDLNGLKRELRVSDYELLKGPLYTEIATRYLDYDTISNKKEKLNYQNQALNYTLLALHQYSAYADTGGLIVSFNNLSKVYISEKKYSEAKWFILQSNTLARVKRNVPGIISSLITLSIIKSEIKDYTLALRDLGEALQLSIANHYPKAECEVYKNYAQIYSRLKNYSKEAVVLKKRDSVLESIRKGEELKLAKLAAKDSLQSKKLDSLQNKKKVYISNSKKLSKGNSTKKTDSL